MAQPEYVPVTERDRVRVSERLPTPGAWSFDRPGEVRQDGRQPVGRRFGVAGPDQGYALKLAHALAPRLVLEPHEHVDDAIAGCLGVALKRAALYGRAPVAGDLELAFALWGFLPGAPADLVSLRRPLFAEASNHYNGRRQIADSVPDETLRMTPDDVKARLGNGGWCMLVDLDGGGIPAGSG